MLIKKAKIRDEHYSKGPIKKSYEYKLTTKNIYLDVTCDYPDDCAYLDLKWEDKNGNTVNALKIFIPQDSNEKTFHIEMGPHIVFTGSKEDKEIENEKISHDIELINMSNEEQQQELDFLTKLIKR